MDQTVQYIQNLVNTESGATESVKSVDTSRTYSITLVQPCTFDLREDLQRLIQPNSTASASPVREIIHYLIPMADLDLGPLGTHHKLDRQSVMHVIIFNNRATIRRWTGDSPILLQDVPVVFEAAINFGKPNVDIFDAPVRLENALKHLALLCRAVTKPDMDPFRSQCLSCE